MYELGSKYSWYGDSMNQKVFCCLTAVIVTGGSEVVSSRNLCGIGRRRTRVM
jgi:hypothetical protein